MNFDEEVEKAVLEMKLFVIKQIVLSMGHASDETSHHIAIVLGVQDQLKDRTEEMIT